MYVDNDDIGEGLGDFWSKLTQPFKSAVKETERVVHKTGQEIGRTSLVKAVAKTSIGKEIQRVGVRGAKVTSAITAAATKGDILKVAGLLNPASIAAKLVTTNQHVIDLANATMPASALQIQDPRLKEKVVGAYAVAAAVAAAYIVAGGMAAGGTTAAVGTGEVYGPTAATLAASGGAAGVGTAITGGIATVGTALSAAEKAKAIAGGKSNIEETEVDTDGEIVKASMFSGPALPIAIGMAAAIGAAVLYFQSRPK